MEQVTTKRKKPGLDLCFICQKDIRTKKSTSTPHGRSRLVEASKQLNDDLLEDIENENIDCTRSEYIEYQRCGS